jgi:hypothetical protein
MSGTRDNSGSFSANKRKEKETHPDIKGKATIGGVAYWISGWKKTNDNGIWYSLSFEPQEQPAEQPAPRGGGAALDDDIPFAAEWR